MGRSSGRSGTGRGTLPTVRDGLGDTYGGPGRVGGPTQRFGTDWGTLPKDGTGQLNLSDVRDGSGETARSLERVVKSTRRSGMGRGTYLEV